MLASLLSVFFLTLFLPWSSLALHSESVFLRSRKSGAPAALANNPRIVVQQTTSATTQSRVSDPAAAPGVRSSRLSSLLLPCQPFASSGDISSPHRQKREFKSVANTADLLKIDYGLHDWRAIVDEKLLYIDKTEAIETLESYGNFCKLWRPRCSGKSLFCQQVAMYYDIAIDNEQVPPLLLSISMTSKRCSSLP